MKRGISTVIGSLIFLIIMLAFFGAFFYMQNQIVNFVSSSLSKVSNTSQNNLEKLDIILAAYDEYLPVNMGVSKNESASYALYDVYKPFDDRYIVLTNTTTITSKNRNTLINSLSVNFTFNINQLYKKPNYLVLVNLIYDLKLNCTPQGGIKNFNLILSLYSSNINLVSTTLKSNSSEESSCRYLFNTGFVFDSVSLNLSNTTFNKTNVTIQLKLQIQTSNSININVSTELDVDFISFRIISNPPNYLNIYVLNNSPFTSNLVQIILFNSTKYFINNTNLFISPGTIKLIQIPISSSNYFSNSNVEIVTNRGNIYQSTISS